MNILKGIEKAKEESKKSDFRGNKISQHLGCAVYYKGTLLAVGHNSNKTHPLQHSYNIERYEDDSSLPKVHAEIMALSKIKYLDIDFNRVEVFVYRESFDGTYVNAKPCVSCEKCIRDMGIKKIHYTGHKSIVSERFI